MNAPFTSDLVRGTQNRAVVIELEARGGRLVRALTAAFREMPERLRGLSRETVLLAHLTPLVSVAWADDRVSERERYLLLHTARACGLPQDSYAYETLQDWLELKPDGEHFEQTFLLLRRMLQALPHGLLSEYRLALLSHCAAVAEASGGVSGLLGGSRSSRRELVETKGVVAQLFGSGGGEQHGAPPPARAVVAAGQTNQEALPESGLTDETAKIIFLLPPVRAAWAEGRVTRRERRLIFSAARSRGITKGSGAYKKLAWYLESKPAEEFFERASGALRAALGELPPGLRRVEEEALLRLCGQVAAASRTGFDFIWVPGSVSPEEETTLERIRLGLRGEATIHPSLPPVPERRDQKGEIVPLNPRISRS